jgi:catechol 2,3-dioxygenase
MDPRLRIRAVHLAVSSLETSVGFYRRVVGLELLSEGSEVAVLGTPAGEPLLHLTRLAEPAPAPPGSTGLFHAAILLPDRRSLAAAARRLTGAGWRLTGASDHGVSEALYLSDPDDIGLELYADRPRDAWPTTPAGGIDIFTAPLDLEDLLAIDPEPGSEPAVPPGTTIGHVHLRVSDPARSVRFYRDVLGLDLIAEMPRAGFLSAGGYHHHVGVNSWETDGGRPAPAHAPGLRLVEMELGDEEAIERLAERLKAAGVEMVHDGDRVALHDPDRIPLAFEAA